MGREKAFVPIDGIPMVLRLAATLKLGGCGQIHLVGRDPALGAMGLPLIKDRLKTHHPLSGVSAALTDIHGELILIAPCDLIHLTPADIKLLLSFGSPCVARSGRQLHPLLAVVPRSWAERALALAEAGAPSMDLTGALPTVELPAHSLTDANTPLDLPRS